MKSIPTLSYTHTQIGYFTILVTLAVLGFFAWIQIAARAETPSVDSGTNFIITAIMVLVLFLLASCSTLTVSIDEKNLKIKYGYGIFKKKFPLADVTSVEVVKNRWYYGWGMRVWFWPYMWIYNVSGFDAVQITIGNKKLYRIGTDEPKELELALNQALSKIVKDI